MKYRIRCVCSGEDYRFLIVEHNNVWELDTILGIGKDAGVGII